MKTDIEIAQEAVLKPITEVAKALEIAPDDLELYGKYKAKISDACLNRDQSHARGRGENDYQCRTGTGFRKAWEKSGDRAQRAFPRTVLWY